MFFGQNNGSSKECGIWICDFPNFHERRSMRNCSFAFIYQRANVAYIMRLIKIKMPWQEKKACANDAIYNNWKGNLQIDELFPLTERDTFSIINPAVKKRTLHISFSTSNQFVVRRGGFCGVGRRSCGEGSWNHDFAWFLWGYAHGLSLIHI